MYRKKNKHFADGHTVLNAPDLFRPPPTTSLAYVPARCTARILSVSPPLARLRWPPALAAPLRPPAATTIKTTLVLAGPDARSLRRRPHRRRPLSALLLARAPTVAAAGESNYPCRLEMLGIGAVDLAIKTCAKTATEMIFLAMGNGDRQQAIVNSNRR